MNPKKFNEFYGETASLNQSEMTRRILIHLSAIVYLLNSLCLFIGLTLGIVTICLIVLAFW